MGSLESSCLKRLCPRAPNQRRGEISLLNQQATVDAGQPLRVDELLHYSDIGTQEARHLADGEQVVVAAHAYFTSPPSFGMST